MMLGTFVQIIVWGVLFVMLNEFPDYHTAIYHSAVNFASLGYGDIVMSKPWKMLGALEAVSGVLMLGIVLWGLLLRARKRLYDHPLFLKACVLAGPLGFVAVVAGWFTTETGRQPWVIYNVMRTADGVSPGVPAGSVLLSLALYGAAYAIVFGAGVYFMLQIVRKGPR